MGSPVSAERTATAVFRRGKRFLALLASLIVAAIAVWLFVAVREQESAFLREAVKLELAGVGKEIAAGMEARMLNLVRLAHRWHITGGPGRAIWEADAGLSAAHFPGTQAISWVDSDLVARWVVPKIEENEILVEANLGFDPLRRRVFAMALQKGAPMLMRTFDLLEGHRGMLAVVPIGTQKELQGFIIAVFRTQELIDNFVANVAIGYGLSVHDNTEEIYYRLGAARELARQWGEEMTVRVAGMTFRVRVWPLSEKLARMHSPIGEVLLIGGLGVALLLGMAVHFAQIARERAADVQRMNENLEREITERRRAEQRLLHFAELVNSSDDAIIGVTLLGEVVSWNAAAARLYGYSSEAMLGHSVFALEHENDRGRLAAALESLRNGTGGGTRFEAVHQRIDGRPVDVALTVSPIREADGTVAGASAIARDITRRKRAEAELREALTRMQQSAEAQRLSLATTTHDVRGALASIAGYADLLSEDIQDPSKRAMVLRIMNLAHTLSDIMTDMLQFARDQHGPEITRQRVSLHAILAKYAEDFALPCKERGLVLHVNLPQDAAVTTDPAHLGRIVQNLLSNAVRYTPAGEVRLEAEIEESHYCIRVSDTGIGIAPEDIERVFDEFYRSEQAKEMEKLGTGVGLSTVRRLARLLGGDVTVRSTLGAGSTFEVRLPRE